MTESNGDPIVSGEVRARAARGGRSAERSEIPEKSTFTMTRADYAVVTSFLRGVIDRLGCGQSLVSYCTEPGVETVDAVLGAVMRLDYQAVDRGWRPRHTWAEMFPWGRLIFWEGDEDGAHEVAAAIRRDSGFDPADDDRWGERIPGDDGAEISYAFHCPAEHLDAIYGGDRYGDWGS